MATIVVLNGSSSVGKTSTARALQRIARDHFLHVQMDAFLEMMPERIWTEDGGIAFDQRQVAGHTEVEIATGPKFEKVMQGMRQSVAALADAGNNCIVDDVMLGAEDQQAYRETMGENALFFVGLHAPLAVIAEREKARGDRMLGLARWQIERVHAGREYQAEVDMEELSPEEAAVKIAERLGIPCL